MGTPVSSVPAPAVPPQPAQPYPPFGGPQQRSTFSPAIYIDSDDQLLVGTWSQAAGVTLRIRARLLLPNGVIQTIQASIVTPNQAAVNRTPLKLAEGWLLSVVALVEAPSTLLRGQCFVQFGIIRGGTDGNSAAFVLFSDYVQASEVYGWPQNPLRWPTDGRGWTQSLAIVAPGAGADIIITAPNNQLYSVLTGSASLATSAAVANRNVQIVVDDGANILYLWMANLNQTAGQTVRYSFSAQAVAQAVAGVPVNIPFPYGMLLQPGWRLRTLTSGIQGGDQWGASNWVVETYVQGT